MANIINGKEIAKQIRAEMKAEVDQYDEKPGLAVLIVGDRPDSKLYVKMKRKAAEEVGIRSIVDELPVDITQEDLHEKVDQYNNDSSVHGILVQLPLPDHLDEQMALDRISIEKDVDGFAPHNIGCVALKGRVPEAVSCTPKGCIELLVRSGIEIEGKRAVVLGRSNIVGIPVALLLNKLNATVTICHSRTQNTPDIIKTADILVAAIGKPEYVRGDWIKPGATIIDVGINRKDDATRKNGYRWVGDVNYEECRQVAGHITPVPGGVGPMTVAMLLRNCLDSFVRLVGKRV